MNFTLAVDGSLIKKDACNNTQHPTPRDEAASLSLGVIALQVVTRISVNTMV